MTYRWDDLANCNAERRRGITHSPEWTERMEREQRAFDLAQRDRLIAEGYVEVGDGVWQGPSHPKPRRLFRFRR